MTTRISARLRTKLTHLTDDAERGDVPGWVLITLMTAGLVAVIWGLAEDQFADLFQRAMDSVLNR